MKGYLSKAPPPKKNIYIYIYIIQRRQITVLDDENSVYYVHKIYHVKPLKAETKVNNHNINFEVDTGLDISLISETTYHKKPPIMN